MPATTSMTRRVRIYLSAISLVYSIRASRRWTFLRIIKTKLGRGARTRAGCPAPREDARGGRLDSSPPRVCPTNYYKRRCAPLCGPTAGLQRPDRTRRRFLRKTFVHPLQARADRVRSARTAARSARVASPRRPMSRPRVCPHQKEGARAALAARRRSNAGDVRGCPRAQSAPKRAQVAFERPGRAHCHARSRPSPELRLPKNLGRPFVKSLRRSFLQTKARRFIIDRVVWILETFGRSWYAEVHTCAYGARREPRLGNLLKAWSIAAPVRLWQPDTFGLVRLRHPSATAVIAGWPWLILLAVLYTCPGKKTRSTVVLCDLQSVCFHVFICLAIPFVHRARDGGVSNATPRGTHFRQQFGNF